MTTSRRSRQTTFDGGSEETLLPTPGYVSGGRSWPRNVEWRDNSAYRENGVKVQVHLHHVVETLGFLPPATPASRSAMPASAPERMTPGTSGRTLLDSLPDFRTTDRIGAFSRTFVATSAWGSTVCSLTWMTSATPQRRGLYLLRASARSTAGTGSGSSGPEPTLLPTPTLKVTPNTENPDDLVNADGTPWVVGQKPHDRRTGAPVTTSLADMAQRMWPTPTVQDDANNAGASQWERNSDPLNVAVQRAQLWPTPMTSSAAINATTPSSQNRGRTNGPALAEAVSEHRPGQKLNPAFVSRLMGYPDGWLDLTDSDQK